MKYDIYRTDNTNAEIWVYANGKIKFMANGYFSIADIFDIAKNLTKAAINAIDIKLALNKCNHPYQTRIYKGPRLDMPICVAVTCDDCGIELPI